MYKDERFPLSRYLLLELMHIMSSRTSNLFRFKFMESSLSVKIKLEDVNSRLTLKKFQLKIIIFVSQSCCNAFGDLELGKWSMLGIALPYNKECKPFSLLLSRKTNKFCLFP